MSVPEDRDASQEPSPDAARPPGAGAPPPDAPAERARRRRWRRVVNRRNAMWTAVVAAVALVAVAFILFVLYRSGRVDRIISNQIVSTLARYNVRAEIGGLRTEIGPRTAVITDLKLYDATTGAPIGNVERVTATVRIEDLWALRLSREVNLETLVVDGLELWVTFDAEGRSNFANIRLPEPSTNKRILFSYSTATVRLNNAVIHYDDRRHELSGEARNLRAVVQPDDPNAPEESRMNRVEFALSNSTFVYDGRPVNDISVEGRARFDQRRADIHELVLRSPVAEARLAGTLDDWRALRYQLDATANVDLSQVANVLQTEAALRGTGQFVGKVSGEGDRYRVVGDITSDALAADNVRLKAFAVNLTADGTGKAYEAQGRAVAELLTAGDFRLSAVQVAGGVTGTGTDFRWLGELRAAALSNGTVTIANLILSDAVAEVSGERMEGGAGSLRAGGLTTSGASPANVSGLEASGVTFRREPNGATGVTVSSARAGQVRTKDATVNSVAASGVSADIGADGRTNVEVDRVQVGGLVAAGARTGSLNVAGVRLSIYDGRVEGRTNDVNVGTVAFSTGGGRGRAATEGRAENVRLARPVFVLEPSGRYRASMDLSLGGGVLGTMPLGAARASVTATNEAVVLDNFNAQLFGGSASGDATLALSPRGRSRVAAAFTNVDIGNLILALGSRQIPLAGAATGSADLSFAGTDFESASGTLNATFSGEAGDDSRGRTPLDGEVALRADRGLFLVERANLRTPASEVSAAGQFSFRGDSNLRLNLASRDASELQRVLVSSGLAPDVATNLERYKVALGGSLNFDGTIAGPLDNPIVNGTFALDSLALRGRDLGSLRATLASNAEALNVTGGELRGRDGGRVAFGATVPRAGENNITVQATLERFNAGNLVAALTGSDAGNAARLSGMGPASGTLNVTGLPGAMSGSANLAVGPGQINGEPLESLTARVGFSGSEINLEALDARFRSGTVAASGRVGLGVLDPEGNANTAINLRASGQNVRLDILGTLFGGGSAIPALGGAADFTASVTGDLKEQENLRVELKATGRDVTINGRPAGELTLTGTTTAERVFNLEFRTSLIGSPERPQVFTAQVNLADEELPATFNTTFDAADLTPLFRVLLPQADVEVTGTATGKVTAQTTILGDEGLLSDAGLGALRGDAVFTNLVVNLNGRPIRAMSPLEIGFTPNELTFRKTRFRGEAVGRGEDQRFETDITFGGTVALREGGRQDLTVDGRLDLSVLNRLSPNILTSGAATVAVRVFGTFADPLITGTAEVARASFTAFVADESLNFTNVNARVRFTTDRAQIDSLEARLGGGSVRVTGGAVLEGLRPSQFRLSLVGDNVTVPFPDEFRTTADAQVELRGTAEAQLLQGSVTVRRTEYTEDVDLADLIERRRDADITEGGGGGDGAGLALLNNLQLDLSVTGQDALVVRNNLADAVGSVTLNVRGSAEAPVIAGRVTLSRGTLNFRNNRFEITRGYVDLVPRRGADPILNIQAEAEISGYRVIAGITGPLSQPATNLRADPALPQIDVVSLILTGNLAGGGEQSASALAQSGLGTATSLLTETLITNPVRRATDKLFGLNRLEIDPLIAGRGGASPTARLTIGRQVTRNLSVTYSTNVTTDQNQVLSVEYRVSDRLSFVAQYQQGPVNSLRTQQNNFNFEIRFRKRF